MSANRPNALIGHTGFVGGQLLQQGAFDACFNSKNVHEMQSGQFGLVVCAGVSAVKWKANREPEVDWAGIQTLLDVLATLSAERFLLISTVDVYPSPIAVDESLDLRGLENHAYGLHRFRLEQFVGKRFSDAFVVRLPALFGKGLKKNVLFDLVHDNGLEAIQPESCFQWYDVAGLWSDLQKVMTRGLRQVNLVTPPFPTRRIVEAFFPGKVVGLRAGPSVSYDVRSRHASALGGKDGYLSSVEEVLDRIGRFVR